MNRKNLVVIGVSTGGPVVLKELFGALPPLNAAFVVVLHINATMDYRIAQGIASVASMPVALAKDGDFLQPGHVYMAPGGYHLQLDANHKVALFQGAKVNFVQPSVDVTMHSLVKQPSGSLVGVILTGMGRDGAQGITHVKQIGGITIAQDQETSTIYGMPKAAFETGAIDLVLPPQKIVAKLIELFK